MENTEFSGLRSFARSLRLQGLPSGFMPVCWYTPALHPIVLHKTAQGQHGGISLRVLQGTATFFSADKVGPGFRLEAVLVAVYRSQTFCLFFS